MHTNSLLLFRKYARDHFGQGLKVLDIGPGQIPSILCKEVKDPSIQWDTLDIFDMPGLTYMSKDEYNFPIEDDKYDIVLATQVIEHVRKIWRWLPELARITKPGGRIIIIGPVSWGYHEVPVDCWRIYPEGMRALCGDAGLEVESSRTESLETPHYKRFSGGVSGEHHTFKKRMFFKIFGPLGFPVERAYDTITIARKPLNKTLKSGMSEKAVI